MYHLSSPATSLYSKVDKNRSDLLTRLGLRAATPLSPTPNYTGHYIIANFLLAYVLLSTRGVKTRYGIDHNENPRHDLATYGEAAVKSGKLTRAQLLKLQRQESAHQNAVEHFPFLVGSLLLATQAGLPAEQINKYALVYTLARIGFAAAYVYIESWELSWLRTIFWWTGNIACIRLCYKAATGLNSLLARA